MMVGGVWTVTQFGDVEKFLQEAEAAKLVPQIVPQIRETLSDQENRINLQLKLAAIVEVGHHFVTILLKEYEHTILGHMIGY